MRHVACWQLMADLVTKLRENDELILASMMRVPRSANTTREVLEVTMTRSKNTFKTKEYLDNLESYLSSVGENKNGKKDIDEPMDKLLKVQISNQTVQMELITKFPLGVPEDKHKVRMQAPKKFHLDRVKHHTQETVLIYNFQEDAGFTPHGDRH